MVAVALMLAGITLLGIVTATLASWIVQRVSEEDAASEAVTAARSMNCATRFGTSRHP